MEGASAEFLRRARAIAGLSQAEVARRANVSQPVISAYERGRREPGLSMLSRLVEATGCELSVEVRPGGNTGWAETLGSSLGARVRRRRRAIIAAAADHGVRNIRLFGSVARGDDTVGSDVDLLVDLDEGVSIIDLIALERELAAILGCSVDVVPARNLKSEVAARILADAVCL